MHAWTAGSVGADSNSKQKGKFMKSLLVTASLAASLAGALATSPAFAAGNTPNPASPTPPKQSAPAQLMQAPALPSVIKSLTYAYAGNNLNITVQGNNGEACGIIIQRQPLGIWDPGQQGVVAVVGKGQRLQLPLTIGYGTGIVPKETVSFSAKGHATGGMPACHGMASVPYNIAPPPPPEVNS